MEVSGQLHSPADLPLEKIPQYPLEAGCALESVWTRWSREKCIALPGIEPRPSRLCYVDIVTLFSYLLMPLNDNLIVSSDERYSTLLKA
jgi:hypothetical protein